MKSSLVAPLTKNQKIGFPEIETSGAFVVGQGQGILKPGVKIPPTNVEIIRGSK